MVVDIQGVGDLYTDPQVALTLPSFTLTYPVSTSNLPVTDMYSVRS